MSKVKYPNRSALREANDIFLDAIRPFIVQHLRGVQGENIEDLIDEALPTDEAADQFRQVFEKENNIEAAIDFSYLPHIIRKHWERVFAQQFRKDMTFQSALWLIRGGRNSCEHRGTEDLDAEFVRGHLFLIADVLETINRSSQKDEVETIRDELFFDDTAGQLESENTELKEALKAAKADNAKLRKALNATETKKQSLDTTLKEVRKDLGSYKRRLTTASKRLETAEGEKKEFKKDLNRTDRRLEATNDKLKAVNEENRTYKGELKTVSVELKEAKERGDTSQECLEATRNLLAITSIGNPEAQRIFPRLDTESAVRLLDRRETNKKDYLLALLERKQQAIIYVQSEERIEQLLELVGPENAAVIGKHSEWTSDMEEQEILDKLAGDELMAVVSSATFSSLMPSHSIEHFVFCHLAPGLDVFCQRCQPAFTSEKHAYLHLIYNEEHDKQWLIEKYPDREILEKLYLKLKEPSEAGIENLCSKLGILRLKLETSLAIFEELQLIQWDDSSVRCLDAVKKDLEESETYCKGEKLKQETEAFCAFQLDHTIEQIWERIVETQSLNIV